MRTGFTAIVFFLAALQARGQEPKRVSVQEGTDIKGVLTNQDIFSYPDFISGKVYFKQGTQSTARLNYNLLLAQVQFIDAKGDTLSLDNENTVREIIIGSDTFYFDKEYLRLFAGNSTVKIAVFEQIKLADKQKTGAYGQQLASSSVNSLSSLQGGSQVTNLNVKQQVMVIRDRTFYVGDEFNHFLLLNKKNILKMFGKKQGVVESYFRENVINFNDEKDVHKLVSFLKQL